MSISITRRTGHSVIKWVPFLPGLFFLVVALLQTVTLDDVSFLDTGFHWLSPLILSGAGAVIQRSGINQNHYRRILGWGVLGFASISAFIVIMILSPEINVDSRATISAGIGVGSFAGMLVGFNEARAIERGRQVERKHLAAKRAEQENARLEHLNHLLRHDILNNITVIEGRATHLLESLSEPEVDQARTIQRQAKSIEDLIDNVRSYMQFTDKETPVREVNLTQTLDESIVSLNSVFPDAEITEDIPDDVTVKADDLLESIFSNLLRNAIVHNRSKSPTVAVSVEQFPERVTVRVADNGPGIPENVIESLDEPPEEGHHGFGLYLVSTFVNRYSGSLTFETESGEGTTAIVTLPRANAETDLAEAGKPDTAGREV